LKQLKYKLPKHKTLFIVSTDAHYYANHGILKTISNYDICSDMFRFTQEPRSCA